METRGSDFSRLSWLAAQTEGPAAASPASKGALGTALQVACTQGPTLVGYMGTSGTPGLGALGRTGTALL